MAPARCPGPRNARHLQVERPGFRFQGCAPTIPGRGPSSGWSPASAWPAVTARSGPSQVGRLSSTASAWCCPRGPARWLQSDGSGLSRSAQRAAHRSPPMRPASIRRTPASRWWKSWWPCSSWPWPSRRPACVLRAAAAPFPPSPADPAGPMVRRQSAGGPGAPQTFPPVGESSFECQQLGQSLQGQMNVKATPNPNFRRVEMRLLNAEQHPVYTVASILATIHDRPPARRRPRMASPHRDDGGALHHGRDRSAGQPDHPGHVPQPRARVTAAVGHVTASERHGPVGRRPGPGV